VTEVEFVRVRDEAALRDGQRVFDAAMSYDLVGFPASPVRDLLSILDGTMNTQPIESWVGYAGGGPAVAAFLTWSDHDNADVGSLDLQVDPQQRRRGLGTAALALIRRRAGELGKARVHVDVPSISHGTAPSPGEQMAKALGLTPVQTELRRGLDLAALDDGRLRALWDEARAASAGYSLLTWLDRVPREHHDDMADLMERMSTDPPQGDLVLEPERWDAVRYLEWEDDIIARGRRRLISVVRDDASGRLVGYTDIGLAEGIDDVAFQWATIVRGEHRGHRLGLVLKLANLQLLRERMPAVEHLNTWNAEDNTHMIAVNEAIGFRVMEAWTKYELPV
jgi:GNAT superfamily N-acetyltransferase